MPTGVSNVQSMNGYHRQDDFVNGDESTASILQSVKEQEAQFEALTRELEAERQSVANQLERCKLGSETASMSSISSTDDSFHWKGHQTATTATESHLEDSDGGGHVSDLGGSKLVDSCLRVLQERGIMNQSDTIPEDSSLPYGMMNGDYTQSPAESSHPPGSPNRPPGSPHGSHHSYQSGGSGQRYQQQPSLAKVVTTREGQRVSASGSVSSQPSEDRGYNSNYMSYPSKQPESPLEHGGPPRNESPNPNTYDQEGRYNDYSNYSDFDRSRNNYANVPQSDDRNSDEGRYQDNPDGYRDYERNENANRDYGNYSNQPNQDGYDESNPYHDKPGGTTPPRASPPPVNDSADYDRYGQNPNDSYGNPPPGMGSGYRPNDSYGVEDDRYSDRPADPYDDRTADRFDPGQRDMGYDHPPERFDGGPGNQYEDRLDDRYNDPQPGKYTPDDSYSDQYRGEPRDTIPYHGALPPEDGYRPTPDSPHSGSYGPPGYGDSRDREFEPETRQYAGDLNAPPPGHGDYDDMPPHEKFNPGFDPSRQSPSIDSQTMDRWRNPELPEVIEFLSHPSDAIKANAAAYLQHLCYMDDNMKAKTRSLNAIPALVELINNEIPEVHRNACGALKNLSFGKANDESKKAIKNAGGIPALIRLLRKTPDNDIRELVTGVLWNLSSCPDLKRPIIDDGLTVIVNSVVIPHSGWDRNIDEDQKPRDVYWSFVFRNASGILRNVSSDGDYARKKLRECEGLIDSLVYLVRAAIGKNDIDNKSVENCICVLRNVSFRCQEVDDPDFHRKRTLTRQTQNEKEVTGCFGGSKKKRNQMNIEQRNRSDSGYQRPRTGPVRGMELLWEPEIVHVYLPLLSDCSNPETLEAAAGAIQNLAACDWQPSIEIRSHIRKEKGLPIIVELLGIEADRVVCAAATALRNLAIDQRNKELIGKYAMRQLVQKLPTDTTSGDMTASNETLAAVVATLHEVIRKNSDFATALLRENGIERLIFIKNSRGKFSPKVVKFAQTILNVMWKIKELQPEYKRLGWREHHFVTRGLTTPNTLNRGIPPSNNNTMFRPRADLGGPTQKSTTNTPITRNNPPGNDYSFNQQPDNHRQEDQFGRDTYPHDDIRSGHSDEHYPKDHHGVGYATIDSTRRKENHMSGVPPGGVPLFPNLPPGQMPQPQEQQREPLYARVDKRSTRKNRDPNYSPPISSSQRSLIPMEDMNNYSYGHTNPHVRLDSTGDNAPGAGADSWV